MRHNRLIALLLLSVACTMGTYADNRKGGLKSTKTTVVREQQERQDGSANLGDQNSTAKGDSLLSNAPASSRAFPDVSRYPHQLYVNVTRQNGFFRGVGQPLTAEQASHHACYYRLSKPVGQGRYAYMQAYNGYGKLTTQHNIGTYLANPFGSDDGIDSEWGANLLEVCQWEVTYNSGGSVETEAAFDADGKLVYLFYPVAIDERKLVGHYTNGVGMPVSFRTNPDVRGVYIERDEHGFDRVIAFVDADLQLIRNADGAYKSVSEYDADGCQLSNMSCNLFDQPMIDNWGNCGWRATHDRWGNTLISTYFDTEGHTMRMPDTDLSHDCVVSHQYRYDNLGRLISCTYLDEQMRPDTTAQGIHQWRLTYDRWGNRTSGTNYGLDSTTLVLGSNDVARWVNHYDRHGNQTYGATYGAQGELVNELGLGDCIHIYHYEGDRQVLREDYDTSNGRDSTLNWRTVSTLRADTTWMYGSREVKCVLRDERGRTLSEAYFDFDGQPVIDDIGYHKHLWTYDDVTDPQGRLLRTTETQRYLMPDGTLAPVEGLSGDWNVQVVETDFVAYTEHQTTYNGSQMLKSYTFAYGDDCAEARTPSAQRPQDNVPVKQNTLTWTHPHTLYKHDAQGAQARSLYADALYYQAHLQRNVTGALVGHRILNEFDEPSYALLGDWDGATIFAYSPIRGANLDENGDTIPDMRALKATLNKAFCVEVIDTTALRLGLRSGDLIVAYGDWLYPEPETAGRYRESHLIYETTAKADTSKTVVLMRHNPATRTSQLLRLNLPPGTPRQLGFVYHMLYLTTRESNHYTNVVAQQATTVGLALKNSVYDGNQRLTFFTPYKVGDDNSAYRQGYRDNVIVIAFEAYTHGQPYLLTFDDTTLPMSNIVTHPHDSLIIHYTVDGHHLHHYHVPNDSLWALGRYAATDDMPTATPQLHLMAHTLARHFDDPRQTAPHLTPQEALATLSQLGTVSQTPVSPPTHIPTSLWRKLYKLPTNIPILDGTTAIQQATYNEDQLTLPQLFQTVGIMHHIDFSAYTWTTDEQGHDLYCLMADTCATEVVTLDANNSLTIQTGHINIPKHIVTLTVVDDGQMRQQGLDGTFALIACNRWHAGQSLTNLTNRIQQRPDNEPWQLVIAPLTTNPDGTQHLAHPLTLTLPAGKLGITYTTTPVTTPVFMQVHKDGRKLAKRQK